MDDYLALIGAAPTSEQAQRALADSLRRRRSFGELGQMTGDKVLSQFGQNLSAGADDYAKQIQRTRLADIDNAQTAKYQAAQMEQMQKSHALQQAMLAETRRGNNLDYAAQMAAIKERSKVSILAAMMKGKDYNKLTDSTRNKMLQHADTAGGVKMLAETFQDGFTQILGPGYQSRLPNAAAMAGIGSKQSKDAAEWWGNWKKFYTLGTRNLLFGATLTPNEQAAWDAVDINPSMSAEQIKTRMSNLFSELRRSAERRGKEMTIEGFDPEVVKSFYEDVFPDIAVESKGQRGRGRGSMVDFSSSSDLSNYSIEDIQNMIDQLSQEGM